MPHITAGLASSGAWGCFDEFNRLVPEVLSVCSLQFKAVTDGLKAYAVASSDGKREKRSPASIVIEEDRVCLDPGCGVFITMNPGYLGRSELPEGLKVICRNAYIPGTWYTFVATRIRLPSGNKCSTQ